MASKLATVIADFTTQLTTLLPIGGTTATLASIVDDDGNTIPNGVYFFTIDGKNSQKEHFFCTNTAGSLTNIMSVTRQGVQATGAVRLHRVGASVTITDFAHLLYINQILQGTVPADSTSPIKYDADFTPTLGQFQIATWDYIKNYADGLIASGAADAGTGLKGLSRLSESPNGTPTALTSISNASPAVCTLTSHGLTLNDSIVFTTTGTLPTGLSLATTYYVISAGLTANAFQVSATLGGSAINTSSAGSGTHSFTKTTPVAVGVNDTKMLTQAENDANAGTSGTPSSTNPFVTQNDTTNAAIQTGTTIAFVNSNPDTITDSGNGFVNAGFQAGQTITVTGSVSNNGTFTIASVVAGTITLVAGDALVAESAGATVTITAATIGKLIRTGSTGSLSPTLITGGGGALTGIVSGENLTAGQPAYINNADSKVYISHGYKAIGSNSWTASTTLSGGKIAKLSDTQFLYLYYSGSTLTVSVTGLDGVADDTETVTTAFDTTAVTEGCAGATVCRLSDTTFIVFYVKTTDSFLYFRTGSISGATITMDTETQYAGNPSYIFALDATPGKTDGEVVLAYQDSTADAGSGANAITGVLSYLTCSTNTATVTYTVSSTLSGAGGSYFSTPVWTQTACTKGIAYALFCATDTGNMYNMRASYIDVYTDVEGSDIYIPNLENQTGTGIATGYGGIVPFFTGHDGKCYFGWSTFAGATATITTKSVIELSTSGARIFYQTSAIRLAGDTTIDTLPIFGNESGVIVMGFKDVLQSTLVKIFIQRGKIYSYIDTTFDGSNIPDVARTWYSNLKDEVVVGSTGTYIKQYRLPTPIDGIVVATVTAPAVASLYNNLAVTTGLTANTRLFLKDTYTTVGDTAFAGTIEIGDALSTTLMRIKQ